MASFYAHYGKFSVIPRMLNHLGVSIGTIENPSCVHFKKEADMIAYLHGDQPTLNGQSIKDRHKFLSQEIDKNILPNPVFPDWISHWRKFKKEKNRERKENQRLRRGSRA